MQPETPTAKPWRNWVRKMTNIVALDADLSGSTKTGVFAKKFPGALLQHGDCRGQHGRHRCRPGRRRQDSLSSPPLPFLRSGRAWEQVRQSVAYPKANVKIVATHGGVTVGEDGGSHQSVEDIAIMRAVPNMTVIVPADGVETRGAIRAAAALQGAGLHPAGAQQGADRFSPLTTASKSAKGAEMRSGTDMTFVTTGLMTAPALAAAERLEKEGISARVVHIATIKPLDQEIILKAARETGAIVTAEEHSIVGGLGGAVAELLGEDCPTPIKRVGVHDRFGTSGKAEELLKYFGLTAEDLVEAAREILQRK